MTLDLDALQALADAATPGPWMWRGNVDHEDPRLVGRNRIGKDGKRRFPGYVEVLWSYPRERQATDAEADGYREYLRDTQFEDGKGGFRPLTEQEIEQHVRDDWLTDQWDEPVTERRMCFTHPEISVALDARELAVFEVAPQATERSDPKVYRADIIDIRHPDAQFIAAAREAVPALIAEVQRLRELVGEEQSVSAL